MERRNEGRERRDGAEGGRKKGGEEPALPMRKKLVPVPLKLAQSRLGYI